jgi:hypothetical protein
MASRKESDKTPGTNFAGTLPANELTPLVPGMAWPGLLGLDVVSVCARDIAAPQVNTAESRKTRRLSQLIINGALLASNFAPADLRKDFLV